MRRCNANYSFEALRATGECVIAIPARTLATTVVKVGNSSGRTLTDKFMAFGLTKTPAKRVAPPLVADCFANLECKVIDTRFVAKYCLFVIEVVQAWIESYRQILVMSEVRRQRLELAI